MFRISVELGSVRHDNGIHAGASSTGSRSFERTGGSLRQHRRGVGPLGVLGIVAATLLLAAFTPVGTPPEAMPAFPSGALKDSDTPWPMPGDRPQGTPEPVTADPIVALEQSALRVVDWVAIPGGAEVFTDALKQWSQHPVFTSGQWPARSRAQAEQLPPTESKTTTTQRAAIVAAPVLVATNDGASVVPAKADEPAPVAQVPASSEPVPSPVASRESLRTQADQPSVTAVVAEPVLSIRPASAASSWRARIARLIKRERMDAARLALAKAELEVGIDPELAKLGARLDMADGNFIGAVDRLQAHPLDGEGQRLLAAASLRSGAADVAVALYQGLLGDAPEDEALWVGLALALEGAGGRQAALRVAYEHLAEAGSDINVRRFAWERLVAMG